MELKKEEKVYFLKWECIFIGEIEKELTNTYILTVKTNHKKFQEIYHGRIAIRKRDCFFVDLFRL